MSTKLFVHPLQASAEHLTASNVADAVQTLTSNDLLHHTAATLYQHLVGVGPRFRNGVECSSRLDRLIIQALTPGDNMLSQGAGFSMMCRTCIEIHGVCIFMIPLCRRQPRKPGGGTTCQFRCEF